MAAAVYLTELLLSVFFFFINKFLGGALCFLSIPPKASRNFNRENAKGCRSVTIGNVKEQKEKWLEI